MRSSIVVVLASIVGSIATPCGAYELGGDHSSPIPGKIQGAFMAAVGQTASADHPRGTIILARSVVRKGVTLTEWDLSRERIVREVPYGWAAFGAAIVRTGDTLSVAAAYPSVHFGTADAKTLQIQHRVDLGSGYNARVGSDGSISAVSWQQPPDKPSRDMTVQTWNAATVDANGRVLGRFSRVARVAPERVTWVQPVVLDGHVYATLGAKEGNRLLKFSPSLVLEKEIAQNGSIFGSIAAVRGHVVVQSRGGFDEFTPDLDLVGHYHLPMAPLDFTVDATGRLVTLDGAVFLEPSKPPITTFLVEPDAWPMSPLLMGDVVVLPNRPASDEGAVDWVDLTNPNRGFTGCSPDDESEEFCDPAYVVTTPIPAEHK
jgi:hypothetical protein